MQWPLWARACRAEAGPQQPRSRPVWGAMSVTTTQPTCKEGFSWRDWETLPCWRQNAPTLVEKINRAADCTFFYLQLVAILGHILPCWLETETRAASWLFLSSEIRMHLIVVSNPTGNCEYHFMFVEPYSWSLPLLWPRANETPLLSCNSEKKYKLIALETINPEHNSLHETHRTRQC